MYRHWCTQVPALVSRYRHWCRSTGTGSAVTGTVGAVSNRTISTRKVPPLARPGLPFIVLGILISSGFDTSSGVQVRFPASAEKNSQPEQTQV